jgi:hypothetical protein
MMAHGNGEGTRWQDDLFDLLRRNNVTQFAYVPDAGHRILIDRSLADPGVQSVALTTEEEGVALIAGADLGGARGVLLMQERRRQLHQHAVPDEGRALPVANARQHARRFRRGEPVAIPDGPGG